VINGNDDWWSAVVAGGTVTKQDTGISAIAGWHELEIDVAGTAVTFKIDGAGVGTGSGIAASNYAPGFFAWNNNSNQTNLFYDWFAAQLNFTR
jgi:hypothetical protein